MRHNDNPFMPRPRPTPWAAIGLALVAGLTLAAGATLGVAVLMVIGGAPL
jgi:hypothetical protein